MEHSESDKIIEMFKHPMTEEELDSVMEFDDVDDDWYEGHGTILNEEKWKLYQRLAASFNALLGKDKALLKVRCSEDPYPFSNYDAVTITLPVVSTPEADLRKAIADAINVCDMFCVSTGDDKKIRMSFSVRNIWNEFDWKDKIELDIDPKNFKDIGRLHFAIQELVTRSDAYDPDEFDRDIVALYLTWYGLTDDEIKVYRKADVLDDGIMIHGEKKTPFPEILGVFQRLRDANGYYTRGDTEDGVIFHKYKDSDYLIRDAGK